MVETIELFKQQYLLVLSLLALIAVKKQTKGKKEMWGNVERYHRGTRPIKSLK